MRVRLFLKALVFLLGTCLHEASHFLMARCVGKAEGFSVIPRIEGDSFVFGSVRAQVRYKVLSSFIAVAPLLWWIILLGMLEHLHVIGFRGGMPRVNLPIILQMVKSFSLRDGLFLWLFIQMLWAGKLSVQDMNNAIKAFFSFSGLIVISAVGGLVYCWRHFYH